MVHARNVARLVVCSLLGGLALVACFEDEQTKPESKPIECEFGTDDAGLCIPKCDPSACNEGNICVNNACVLACTRHVDCPDGFDCSPAQDDNGQAVTICAKRTYASEAGQFLAPCPMGDECDEANKFTCLGAGPGDADAYCTRWDCTSDADCPSGLACEPIRVGTKVCGRDDYGDAEDPNPCIEPSDYTKDGATYREGPITLLRNACVKRRYCSVCDSDLDCSRSPDLVCSKTDSNAQGICAPACNPKVGGCPWMGASTCEESSSVAVCRPTYGACVGDGSACSPCRNDLDCWSSDSSTRNICWRSAMGEPFCIDMDTRCATDDDCPVAPSGLRMHCMVEVPASSWAYRRCLPPDNGTPANPGHLSCWAAP